MYTKIEPFLTAWKYEAESTGKIMAALTDASLATRVGPEDRTLGRIAWHVTGSLGEMMNRVGLALDGPGENDPVPVLATQIAEAYERLAAALGRQVKERWTDETLAQVDEMYGDKWPRGLTLEILIRHQAHHRGQMTVLMRQAGLRVPGVYGPAREEWAQFGAPAPEI